MWLRKRVRFTAILVGSLLATLETVACREPGQVRAGRSQVVGVYEIKLHNGVERLELKDDGTYSQDFSFESRPFHQAGQWRISDRFLSGTDVMLTNAAVTEDDEKRPLRFGDLTLNVHDHEGNLALARNEVADWYFERAK